MNILVQYRLKGRTAKEISARAAINRHTSSWYLPSVVIQQSNVFNPYSPGLIS